jgi:hypothetical protein
MDIFPEEEIKGFQENKTYKKIKVLRIDNGGELCGNKFDQF